MLAHNNRFKTRTRKNLQTCQKPLVNVSILIYNVITRNLSNKKGGISDEKIIQGSQFGACSSYGCILFFRLDHILCIS